MSGFQAFVSFVEFCKDELDGVVDVIVDGDAKPTGAYMHFEIGPVEYQAKWAATQLCQARLWVPGTSSRPAFIVGGELYDDIMTKIRDRGTLDKYDYASDGTSTKTGVYNYDITDETSEMADGKLISERVLTFELYTNAKS